jgi:hypothetical protein
MTLVPIATPATSMNYFRLAVVAMAWTIAFLFLALRFFFTVPVIWGIAIGLATLVYAMVALMSGTLRVMLGGKRLLDSSESGQRAAQTFQRVTLIGAGIIAVGVVGQLLEQLYGYGTRAGLQFFWPGLLVFGLVIQLYGEAAYLKNRG